MNGLKAAAKTVLSKIAAHKVVSVIVAAAIVVGTASGIAVATYHVDPTSLQLGYEVDENNQVRIIETMEEELEGETPSESSAASSEESTESEQSTASESSTESSQESAADTSEPTLAFEENIHVPKNSVIQLHAVIQPENATDKSVTFTSDNEALALVDETGKVSIANAEGAVTIGAQTVNGLTAHVTIDVTKTDEEIANEEIVKALAEINAAAGDLSSEEAEAKIAELQEKYQNAPDDVKQQMQTGVSDLKRAVSDKKAASSSSGKSSSGGGSTGGSSNTGGGSGGNTGGNTGGGSTGGGGSGGGGSTPDPTPQPSYPSMTPAEMEAYGAEYAISQGFQYGPLMTKDNSSYYTPFETWRGMTNDDVKRAIRESIDTCKYSSPVPQYYRIVAETYGNSGQYRVYCLMG